MISNEELIAMLENLSQEHFVDIANMVDEMNAHSHKQKPKQLAMVA